MVRRTFLAMVVCLIPSMVFAKNRKFVFKIKTKSKQVIGNIVIEADNAEHAKYKLRQRYPDCEIMSMEEK